jgi:hypothetical protein
MRFTVGKKSYSAGMVKHSFWFSEFKKMITMINEGMTLPEIKRINIENNIFSAPTTARSTQIFNNVSTRVKAIDESFYALFDKCDVTNQKLINLIAIMNSDSLFFDFVYEVYREHLNIGIGEISEADVRVFFKNKQVQNERVAAWKDYTLKRLGDNYITMLLEAGVLVRLDGTRSIIKPILDISLEQILIDNHMNVYLNALTGVR